MGQARLEQMAGKWESYIGRKCDIFWGGRGVLEQVHKEQVVFFRKCFYTSILKKICNFTRISVLPISLLGDLTRLNQFDSFPWLVGTPSGVSQRTYPDYSPPLSHTREPGLEKWAEHLHLSWIRWTLSESNDCCSNKRTSTRIVTPSSNNSAWNVPSLRLGRTFQRYSKRLHQACR